MALKRQRLCQRRKALGYSQERLADLLGVERSTVVRWENAETDPHPWHRTRIAFALGVTLEHVDDMLADVSVAKRRGQAMANRDQDHDASSAAAARPELLGDLRSFLTDYLTPPARPTQTPAQVRRSVRRVHDLYQRASYTSAARLLPDVLRQATELSDHPAGPDRRDALRLLAAAYLAAAKLAAKVGDGETALLSADRAATAARLSDDKALMAIAAYQAACGLLRMPGRAAEAADMTRSTIDHLAASGSAADPDLLSAHGALLLLAAVMAAGQGNAKESAQHLSQAEQLAADLGTEQNRLWTAFGPTNVAIHSVSAAVHSRRADQALEIGSRLDTSRLPAVIVGRRAQVHIDLAAAAFMSTTDRPTAVLHLLEAERVAAEAVYANVQARAVLLDLMTRERRAATPGLRPLAERAGLLA
ncbi:helix-turn-helix transcriptional regulator [Micromonospora humi]|uniref:DNA-binding transcriptional regulator, XRE-family HTH domain n=1 Tax=Micromonospora humi TaxID=745366 RepID=A0A1C5K941_9ACTN|nr:helix-turn-helix transcriptional regulator [Micromonospora humi]SCG79292.1 DNA-binding transcriptional regulator, XRE-family HTH domain [Micromonospora humi]